MENQRYKYIKSVKILRINIDNRLHFDTPYFLSTQKSRQLNTFEDFRGSRV